MNARAFMAAYRSPGAVEPVTDRDERIELLIAEALSGSVTRAGMPGPNFWRDGWGDDLIVESVRKATSAIGLTDAERYAIISAVVMSAITKYANEVAKDE